MRPDNERYQEFFPKLKVANNMAERMKNNSNLLQVVKEQ